jgi:YHS domain-containing protein
MKRALLLIPVAALAAAALTGCARQEAQPPPAAPPPAGAATSAAVQTGAPLGTVKVGDRAVCAICAVKEGTAEPEEVKDTLDYQGKTYAFCNLNEKAEFISDPGKYTK